MREIEEKYGVCYIVRGAVRPSGTTARISIRVQSIVTEKILWGNTLDYDIESQSQFEIEDDVTSRVSAAIADNYGAIARHVFHRLQGNDEEHTRVEAAMLLHNRAHSTLDIDALRQSFEALQHLLNTGHVTADIVAALTSNYFIDATLDLGFAADSWDRSLEHAGRAVTLEPSNQFARHVLASVYFLHGHKEACRKEVAKALELNPHDAQTTFHMGNFLALTGEWERGLPYIKRAMQINPNYPIWYHFPLFLDFYRKGAYQDAWSEVVRMQIPNLYWVPLIQATTLAQLGRREEARIAYADLLKLKPNFPHRARELMRPGVFLDETKDMLLLGFYLAGLYTTPTIQQSGIGTRFTVHAPTQLHAPD